LGAFSSLFLFQELTFLNVTKTNNELRVCASQSRRTKSVGRNAGGSGHSDVMQISGERAGMRSRSGGLEAGWLQKNLSHRDAPAAQIEAGGAFVATPLPLRESAGQSLSVA
jgi:hypothetical protein